jgi:hypothetical protein
MNIFDKPYFPLHYFGYEIFVKCPKCESCSKITTLKEGYFSEREKSAKLTCKKCGHLSDSQKKWEGYYIGYAGQNYRGRSCGFCGSEFNYETEPTKQPFETELIKCNICNKEKKYQLNWYRHYGGKPIDPYFGLELYFKKEVKGETLWIYNKEHLEYLKDYISSNIRKREYVGLYALVTRLPNFITNSKNKNAIINQLNKFDAEIIKIENYEN